MSQIFKVTAPSLAAGKHSPVDVYLANLAAGSRPTMRSALDILAGLLTDDKTGRIKADSFPWEQLRYEHTSMLRAELQDRYSASTANKMLAALRQVLMAAWKMGRMSADDYMRAVAWRRVEGNTKLAGREIEGDELRQLLTACAHDSNTTRGIRDTAIIAVLRVTGIRRAELCNLSLSDYNRETQTITVRGKRNKRREVYVFQATAQLSAWIKVRSDKAGPLFCRVTKGGNIQLKLTQHLDTSSINYILGQREKQAGLKKRATPHDFRRTVISGMLDTIDISTVQKFVGHEDVSTTSRYDRRGDKARRKAAETIKLPGISGLATSAIPTVKKPAKKRSKQ